MTAADPIAGLQARLDNALASRDEARASIRDLGHVITSILDQRDEATTECEQLREENAALRARIDELEGCDGQCARDECVCPAPVSEPCG